MPVVLATGYGKTVLKFIKSKFGGINPKTIAIVLGLVLVLLVVPARSSHAGVGDIVAGWFSSLTGMAFDVLAAAFFNIIFYIIQQAIVFLVYMFNLLAFVHIDSGLPVIKGTWKIIRDFANMFFIIVLIWMAFATIFDAYGKNGSFGKMIWRLVIVAVLINFSLAIGGVVVDMCQVLTNVFLKAIGDPSAQLLKYLNPTEFFHWDATHPKSASIYGTIDSKGAGMVSIVFYVVISAMFMFSMLIATVFALFRIFIIWGLLMISPSAWMAFIFPGTEGWWKKWWSWFLGWNLFLPIYLFFLYLGFYFLSQRTEIMNAIASNAGKVDAPIGATSLTFNLTFFYIFGAVIFAFGAVAAVWLTQKTSASGFEWGVNSARNWVKKMPGFSSYYAAQNAAGARAKQFQQEGFQNKYLNKIYGGEEAAKRQQAAWDRRFGVGGTAKAQKDYVANVKKIYDDVEEKYDTGQLDVVGLRAKVAATKADSAEGHAYRKLALQKGALSNVEFKKTLLEVQDNPYAVQDLMKTAKDKKFAGIKDLHTVALDPALKQPSMVAAKRDMLMHIATDSKTASKLNAPDLDTAKTTLGGNDSPEFRQFVKDLGKTRPDLTIDWNLANPDPSLPAPIANTLWDKVLNTDTKNVVDMPLSVWNRAEFQSALSRKLGVPGARTAAQRKLRNKLASQLLTAEDGTAKQALLP